MTSHSNHHGSAKQRTGAAGDIHDIRALTDTGVISLPDRARMSASDRTSSDGTRPTPRAAG